MTATDTEQPPLPEATTPEVQTVEPKEDHEEPQNTLTKKFTEDEWKAVKSLRSELPEIFAEVYGKDEATTSIKLWGVTIDSTSSKDARASVVLVKFLRARNLNVAEARAMIVATLRWRKEFDIDKAVTEQFPPDIFGNLGHIYGHDKEEHPVTYNLYGGNKDLKAVFGDVERFLRWRVALMEKGVALLDFETTDQILQVHDYEGVTMSSRDENSKKAASETTTIFQNHYPELLYKKYFINVPSLLTWIFWLFKPIISAKTLAKMTVVGSGKLAISKALLPVIPADQLPKRYGGEADAF